MLAVFGCSQPRVSSVSLTKKIQSVFTLLVSGCIKVCLSVGDPKVTE